VELVVADACGKGGQVTRRWTGTGWRIQATPTPSQAYDLDPPAIACPAVTACIAVGGYTTNTPKLTLAERWNGTGQSGLLANSRSAALGNSFSACPRTLLLGLPHLDRCRPGRAFAGMRAVW
jgi:hypothetical protein